MWNGEDGSISEDGDSISDDGSSMNNDGSSISNGSGSICDGGFICDICVDRGCDLSGGIGLVTLNEVCNNLTIVICSRYGDANLIMSTIVAMNAVTGTNKYIYSTRILQFTSIAQFCHNEPTRNLPLLRIMSIS